MKIPEHVGLFEHTSLLFIESGENDLVEEGRIRCVGSIREAIFVLNLVWWKMKLEDLRMLTLNHEVIVAM